MVNNKWDEILKDEYASEYFAKLQSFLSEEYKNHTVFPEYDNIFNALKITDFDNVRAVILGQDPYHGRGQAHGLCFSVPRGSAIPPSLLNIYKELNRDLGIKIPDSGDLSKWASNGVLLLNSVLTVRENEAGSHANKGWEIFTDRIISKLNEREQKTVFILWGAYARKKATLLTNKRHLVLETVHPSPLSAYNGFFGSRHFSAANAFLGDRPIDWSI